MQESLFNTVQKLQQEQKVNVEELEVILNTDIEQVVSLCKKACLKPKTDSFGNAYFTRDDVDILKKMKELYEQAQHIAKKEEFIQQSTIEVAPEPELDTNKKINFLQKAKNRIKTESIFPIANNNNQTIQIQNSLLKLENNLIKKMSEILSEKMDGFDEIIVELIRSKTENENLRNQVNSLNKQVFVLKNELASFQQLPFGLYTKKDNQEL